ncbi:MAG: hypothetical protein RMM17_09015 [Acidobacteriota bacterium]|nr:hypothetical protein [Blastocatellia bacterium]MDW8412807.1 hypothetical protein [Acidobacteriota bacterium]
MKIQEGMAVVLSLHSPREKVWGILADLSPSGIQIRGIDLNTFDDWVRMVAHNERNIGLTYVFFPMWRVERVSLDETVGDIISLEETFRMRVGISIYEYLGSNEPSS